MYNNILFVLYLSDIAGEIQIFNIYTPTSLLACIHSKVEELLEGQEYRMSTKDLTELKEIEKTVTQKIGFRLRNDGKLDQRFKKSINFRHKLGIVSETDGGKCKEPKSLPLLPLQEYEKKERMYKHTLFMLLSLDRTLIQQKEHEGVCDQRSEDDDTILITEVLEPLTKYFINNVTSHFDRNSLLQRVKICSLILLNRIIYDSQTGNNLAEQTSYKEWRFQFQVTIAFAAYVIGLCYYCNRKYETDALKDCIDVSIENLLQENIPLNNIDLSNGSYNDGKILGKIFITEPYDIKKYTVSKMKKILECQLEEGEVNTIDQVVQKVRLGLTKNGEIDKRFKQSIKFRFHLWIVKGEEKNKRQYEIKKCNYQALLFDLDKNLIPEKYKRVCNPNGSNYPVKDLIINVLEPLTKKYASCEVTGPVDKEKVLKRIKLCSIVTMLRILCATQFKDDLADDKKKGGYKKWRDHLQLIIAFSTYTAALCIFYKKTFNENKNPLDMVHSISTE